MSKPQSRSQDLPPKGGYQPIQTARVGIRRIISPTIATGLTVASMLCGGMIYFYNYRRMRRDEVELKSAQMAVLPALLAEKDRAFLKQLWYNRVEEQKLMEDYPGWKVGTYFGEPIYVGDSGEDVITPIFAEYVIHSRPSDSFVKAFRYQLT